MSEIEIPETLVKKIEDVIKDTSFNSISDYITYVLEELLKKWRRKKRHLAKKRKK